ncbi:restriction endonuclease subunit S [Bacillus altitudinis]|uniref:restriction endonuclease subunit S n=1 Tax=Bacillus altitudinis TaxID=293387 RepID=UPI003982832A
MGSKRVPEVRFEGFRDEWIACKLGEKAEILTGGTPRTQIREYWEPKEVPWMSSGEINKKRILYTDNKISKLGLNNSSARWISENSVLIALAGQGKTRGTVAINLIPLTINQSIAAIIPKGELYYEFIYQNLAKRYEELRIISSGDGTRGGLNKQILSEIEIVAPSFNEQIKIGNLLKQLDETIAFQQQELDTLKQTKQGFLQKMFPKEGESVPEIRFSGFSSKWCEQKLKKVFKDFIVPMRDKPKEFSGTIPWTRIEDIEGRFINGTTSGQYVSEEIIKSMNLKIMPKGSLIVSSSATFGIVAIVTNDLITNQTFIGLVPKDMYDIDYLYVFFKSVNIQKKMKRASAGSTIFYISRKQFEEMIGSFPTLEEQTQIGNFFKQLDETIALHEQELNILKQTKKAFLQKMFV